MLLDIFYILAGFLLLVKGGDYLVDGSVALARRARLSAMVIGMTVVGFGTSMPEFLVSVQSAIRGSSGLALGNVVGSNIANIGLILGLTSLVCPLPSGRRMLRVDVPFMLVSMAILVGAASCGVITRWMGVAMAALLVWFIWWEIRRERKSGRNGSDGLNGTDGEVKEEMPLWRALLLVVLSIAGMVWGADLLIDGSSNLALVTGEALGVGREEMERVIGLTVVALGTSLPELFASVIAARRGETDMAVGNIIGSVTFNILCVVGFASAITPIGGAWGPFVVDYGVMLVLGVLLWVFLYIGHRLSRWEGAVLLAIYVGYIAWIGGRL